MAEDRTVEGRLGELEAGLAELWRALESAERHNLETERNVAIFRISDRMREAQRLLWNEVERGDNPKARECGAYMREKTEAALRDSLTSQFPLAGVISWWTDCAAYCGTRGIYLDPQWHP